eukprot:TRINITY_DN58602_c0_g1_i1.p1 TRINITY_DN58602_c0_g1~~TRINITY_DN58602_c0_g1_i1.p1  ORF type:complete len:584 (+),score=90.63 TRINITY_DN58602_c0_g1_i1:117-1868(+)
MPVRPMVSSRIWRVVGGSATGGVLVREHVDLASSELPERLEMGATAEELAVQGHRMLYKLLDGSGPLRGWVSLNLKGRPLLEMEEPDAFTCAEEAAVSKLASSYRELHKSGDSVDTRSQAGLDACSFFLEHLADSQVILRIEASPRAYRSCFTSNYRALFPDDGRYYLVPLLEASIEKPDEIEFNRTKFRFSEEVKALSEALQHSWTHLARLLERWSIAGQPLRLRLEFQSMLYEFDLAWASFEHKYIANLIDIENEARQILAWPIRHEHELRLLEARHGALCRSVLPAVSERLGKLVSSIAHLNLHTNDDQKVRDDLSLDVLLAALGALPKCKAAHARSETPAEVLSRDVIDSFVALRKYLGEIGGCMEFVDPNLANNAALVSRLLDWEKSWGVGRRYLMKEGMLEAICHIVAEIKKSQEIALALASMCEEHHVELFMALPRIMWLCFLENPARLVEIFKSLVPHYFLETTVSNALDYWPSNPELSSLRDKYRIAFSALSASTCKQRMVTSPRVVLIKRAVRGRDCSGVESIYATVAPARISEIEDFMRELEVRSIELQRSQPRHSNEFNEVLIRCMVRCLK